MDEYVIQLKNRFEQCHNEVNSPQMAAYMKHRFEFYGLKKPERQILTKAFVKQHGYPAVEDVPELMHLLWNEPYRELHYFGLEILDRFLKKMDENAIELIEYLLTNQSWWDTVDWLAIRTTGTFMKLYPECIHNTNKAFVESENFWLNRTAIIFQLKYKSTTNTNLLTYNILRHNHQKEFFIRKAIGWALREYSKTDEAFVRDFVATHELSALSKKEALKWLNNR